ncbi:hypothetical protein EDD16DRAFT_1709674 [Pisolithus croceorrhizus]|nr:hypothetical protein EDD16DRAFT_1709674 [Pisolithus croceorrhizus]
MIVAGVKPTAVSPEYAGSHVPHYGFAERRTTPQINGDDQFHVAERPNESPDSLHRATGNTLIIRPGKRRNAASTVPEASPAPSDSANAGYNCNGQPHLKRERIPIEFKGQEYFESLEYAQSKEMIALMEYSHKAASTASLPSVPGKKSVNSKTARARTLRSSLTENVKRLHLTIYLTTSRYAERPHRAKTKKMRKNVLGKAHHESTRRNPYDDGTLGYYPFISLFNYARVRINPGPDFEFPPPPDIEALLRKEDEDIKPSCETDLASHLRAWDLDAQEEEEAKVEMAAKAERLKAEAAKQAQKERRKRQTEAKKRAKEAETRQG